MGTDIHIAIEVRRSGRWQTWGRPPDESGDRPPSERWVHDLLEDRCYPVFALFGVRTERFTPDPPFGWRDFPSDMDPRSYEYVSHEHSETWATLEELLAIDWSTVKYSEKFVAGLRRLRKLGAPADVRLVICFDS